MKKKRKKTSRSTKTSREVRKVWQRRTKLVSVIVCGLESVSK